MPPDGIYTGVVDRFEEDAEGAELAVILLEEDGEVVEQLDLPRSSLPADAGQDAILEMAIVDGDVDTVEFDPEETKRRSRAAQDRFDRLAERPPSRRDQGSDSDGEE